MSAIAVLVLAAPARRPSCFAAALGARSKPLVHGTEGFQSARIAGIRVVDDAVLDHERADARPLGVYVATSVPVMAANSATSPWLLRIAGTTAAPGSGR